MCTEVFRDPVILPCSHSFCKLCLHSWWTEKDIRECPLCKDVSNQRDVLCNLALKNLCETFSSGLGGAWPRGDACPQHRQKLKLFCVQDQELVCVACRELHQQHRLQPTAEAAQGLRQELQDTLRTLQDHMKLLNQAKVTFHQTADFIKVQTRLTGVQIREEFKKLRLFLQEEEKLRLAALREEEQRKSQMMKDRMELLKGNMLDLLDLIKTTEEALRAPDLSVLIKYRTIVDRVQHCPPLDNLDLPPGTLIDQAKHLGNLGFNIWASMKDQISFSPVILDPNTVSPELILSEDLTSARCGGKRQLPENPERMAGSRSILGSEGFSCGAHSWEVCVENQTCWDLGVLQEAHPRKGDLQSGLWRIQLCNNQHRAISPPRTSVLLPVQTLQKVRVDLDLDQDRVSFFNAATNEHIHTFTHTFSGRVFPYIWTGSEGPIRILPLNIKVFPF